MYEPIKVRLAVLGSTGSIGQQTLQVVRSLPERFNVVGLAAGQNLKLFKKQVEEFQPQIICYDTSSTARETDFPAQFLPLESIASYPNVDTVVIATAGIAGLTPTLAATVEGKNVAIANKEPLVMAGHIIIEEAEMHGASIIPIDSEHSAILQCMIGEPRRAKNIILTASGGPFKNYTLAQMKNVTPEQALQHPSWQMGKKVTIDSATLMNKGLEIIEAHWLFGIPIDDIRVVIHPQSIIHSMLEFYDTSVKAQMAYPDMRLPIQYALLQPDRVPNDNLPRIDWQNLKELTFEQPDLKKFPCLKLAIDAGKAGGSMTTALCAADEVAVDLFLKGKIRFTDIAGVVSQTLDKHELIQDPGIEDIFETDARAREYATDLVQRKK